MRISTIIAKRIENEPPDSKVIPTCDIRLLLMEIDSILSKMLSALFVAEFCIRTDYGTEIGRQNMHRCYRQILEAIESATGDGGPMLEMMRGPK